MRKQYLLFEKTHNIFTQALPYLCLPQHLPAHHLGPGFLHLYTPGGEYLPRKLDPVRQIQDFLTYPCMISVLSDIAVVCPTYLPPTSLSSHEVKDWSHYSKLKLRATENCR